MIDFTNYKTEGKSYGGANGSKKSLFINGELYMLKLPNHNKLNPNLSYMKSAISEHLASTIFNLIGIEAQETILGQYTYHDVTRFVITCKDFEYPYYKFHDFASLRNQIVDSITLGHSTELRDLMEIFEMQSLLKNEDIKKYFWDIFIVDALLENWDRHNGNWGYLWNQNDGSVKLAPVFDNGSSLFPQADEVMMQNVLKNKKELNLRIYDLPKSAITIEGKKINYY